MSEEIDPKFIMCLVNKSKYYFKKELVAVGTVLLIAAGVGLIFILFAWIASAFAIDDYKLWAIIILDLIVFGELAFAYAFGTDHILMNFIKGFFKLHVIAAIAIFLFILGFICLTGISFMAISLVWLIFSEVLGFGVIGGLISGIITGIIIIPVHYSAFICFKIDSWIDERFNGVVSWL